MSGPNGERCDGCYFFEPVPADCKPDGFCHRYPADTNTDNASVHAMIDSDDWCGEFKPLGTLSIQVPGDLKK